MARIGLIDVDGHGFPNLALMKIAGYHNSIGDDIEWYSIFEHYEKVYMSKVFTFTQDFLQCISNADEIEKGGTGYKMYDKVLPSHIDRAVPFYDIYGVPRNVAYGFLTRGCVNKCEWCIVPKKEGVLREYMDVEEIAVQGRNKLILMDNNILASEYGLNQLEKIVKKGYSVDFNQGLDARKVDDYIADVLAMVKWSEYVRFACDTTTQIPSILKACNLLKKHGYTKRVFVYCLLRDDIQECVNRLNVLRDYNELELNPFAQPYIDFEGKRNPPQWQRDLARWCNVKSIFKSVNLNDYQPRKNFKFIQYYI